MKGKRGKGMYGEGEHEKCKNEGKKERLTVWQERKKRKDEVCNRRGKIKKKEIFETKVEGNGQNEENGKRNIRKDKR